ncbi:MAG: hypothetical protein ABI948_12375 [Thermoleophilia bacterium]
MKVRLFFAAAASVVTALAFAGVASAGLNVVYVFNGHGGYSADGLGQNGGGGSIQAEVPAGSTVEKAFLLGTYFGASSSTSDAQRLIDFDGTNVQLVQISSIVCAGCGFLKTAEADVTAQVAAKVGAGGGITNFTVNNDPVGLDGVSLVVVYSNAALPESTVAVLDGSSQPGGDTTTFNFAAPLDKTIPGFSATMSLGSGFSFQGGSGPGTHVCAPFQFSTVDVNGARLTSCAGNYDDGQGNDGGLITVGGVGDLTDNPVNPNIQAGVDDELYNIAGFLHQGDTSAVLQTANPSNNDNLFLAVIDITAKATVNDPAITATGKSINATEGAPFSGVVASFTDPDTAATAAEYSATIDWGDGTPLSIGTISGPTGGPFNVSGSHTYLEEGSYTITVVITDKDTASNTATAESHATVADAPLTGSCTDSTSLMVFNGVVQTFSDADPNVTVTDYSATINWGDSSSSPGTIAPSGAQFTVSGTHVYAATGSYTITTTTSDVGGSQTTTACKVLVGSFAAGGGSFVIGNLNSSVGTNVTFWGAQWWKLNSLTGGAAPAAFKGFAKDPASPSCGSGWSTDPGNSAPPPAGPLPPFMAVIVSSSISKSGSTISGNSPHIVIVQTNPGYDANPGHAGTGKVVATLC